VRGGVGLVFLLLSLTFGLMVAHLMLQPVEMITRQIAEHSRDNGKDVRAEVLDRLVEQAQPAVAWVLSERNLSIRGPDRDVQRRADAWAAYLLRDRPAMLSAIFLILLFGWPLIVAFGAFDLFAGDIASRQLRYQLLRADRGSIFVGRLAGTLLTFVLVVVLLGLTVAIYMGVKLPHYGFAQLVGWSAYGIAALLTATLPYVALCAWMSASIASSFGSLTAISLVIGGVPLFAMFGRMTWEPAGWLNMVLPWGFQTRLFHHEPVQVALAACGCLGQAALFGWLGWRKFTRRDL
jgi:hypothetical protein